MISMLTEGGTLRIHRTTGWWIVWALSEGQRIKHVFMERRGSIHVLYPHVAMDVTGCQTVTIGCDKYVTLWASVFIHIGGSHSGHTVWVADWVWILLVWYQESWGRLAKHSTFGSAIPGWAEVVAVKWAGHQVCTRNEPGTWLGRRCVPNEAAVIQMLKYLGPIPLTIYRQVSSSVSNLSG